MSRLVVTMFLTLDGVVQAPGGPDEDRDGGFAHGGWAVPHFDDTMLRTIAGWFEKADSFLLGRRTYEIFASHWPRVTDPEDVVASRLNGRPKFVASKTLQRADWKHASVLKGDVAEVVRRLKATRDGELQVHGSGALVQTLIANDLVDEYRLWVFPVVVGSGKRLFGQGTIPSALTLVDAKTSTTGVSILTYERVGAPAYGAMGLETEASAE